MAIKRVDGYMTTDGKVFANESEAVVAEHDYQLRRMAYALAESIKPAYGTMYARTDEIAFELMDNLNDVLLLADAIRARWPERDPYQIVAPTLPTAHAPADGPERED